MAVNLIRKNNSDAITAAMDAAMYYTMVGEGVFNGTYSSCAASVSNSILTIQPGLISIGGRIVEIPENNPVKLEIEQFGTSNAFYIKINVTIEDDDSQSNATIYGSIDSTQSTRHALTGADTYTTNLFLVAYSTATRSYVIKNVLPLIEPGVALNATSLLTTGQIGNTPVSSIFELSGSGVSKIKNCKQAETATEAEGFAWKDNGSGKNVNEVSSNLYMPQRGVYLCIGAVLMNNITISNVKAADFSVTIDSDTSAVDIPFDSGASLGSISRYALVQVQFDGIGGWVIPGGYLQNGENLIIDNSDTTFPLERCEIEINYTSKKLRIRFAKATSSLVMSVRVIGIGAA